MCHIFKHMQSKTRLVYIYMLTRVFAADEKNQEFEKTRSESP